VVILGIMVGRSLWLDRRSDTVLATVSGKTEEIQCSYVPQGERPAPLALGFGSSLDGRRGWGVPLVTRT
jgi:hypothetical protein